MPAQRSVRTGRSLTFISALMLSTAIAAPAFAQIEEVVVTAQKRSEDIQTVPIAISAFTSQDLAAHQIKAFKDIQFAMPNVTVSNGTFGASNFEIRGIGSGAVAVSGDAGVSINQNEVYLSSAPVTSSTYFDIQNIEVLRGPQGTLFGQNATGGAVNVITNKPDLDNFASNLEGTYGNYSDEEVRAMVNIPIVDGQLAARFAGFWENRSGDISNIYGKLNPGSGLPADLDSRHDWSMRGSVRWEPTSNTTIDFLASTGKEDDSRARTIVQSCTTDPSGVLGCLPSARTFQNINLNSVTNTLLLSNISPLGGTPLQLFQVTGAGADQVGSTAVIPGNSRSVDTDFQPVTTGEDNFESLTWQQRIFSWLNATFIGGLDHQGGASRQATEGTPGDPFSLYAATGTNQIASFGTCTNPAVVATQRGAFTCGVWQASGFTVNNDFLPAGTNRLQAMETIFSGAFPISGSHYFSGSHFGLAPISGPSGFGLSSGDIQDYAAHMQGYDQIGGSNAEKSFELRFQSSFNGPFNFTVGASHLEFHDTTQYYVAQSGIDLASILFGADLFGDGNLAAPSVYDNNTLIYHSKSSGVFGDATYDIVPDLLKLTAGLRWTTDEKSNIVQQSTLSCPAPIGSSVAQIQNILTSTCPSGAANPVNPFGTAATAPLYQKAQFDATTGRAVLTWTPKVDFTDQTMVYLSYAHGNRPGGFNPPSFIPGLVPNTFAPENIDAYELGTKNTLLDGTLQADMTAWYYNYKGYQISSIVNRTSLNVNINSTLYGVEGQFIWAPDSHWAFNMNFGLTQSSIGAGDDMQVDTRNPTHGDPDAMVLKDYQGSNCIIQNTTGPVTVAMMNALAAALPGGGASTFVAPPVALPTSIAASSAYINASSPTSVSGGTFGLSCATMGTLLNAMNTFEGQHFVVIPTAGGGFNTPGGIAVSVKGNEMPNTPPINVSFGAQYTFDMDGGYNVVPRIDYYWKSRMFSTVFNTPEDKIESWDEVNAQIQLNAPENLWYARAWIKNAFAKNNITSSYTGADSQGLFTNLFLEEPRTFGITLGVNF
jgi:iron complex outermembrane receptor protein